MIEEIPGIVLVSGRKPGLQKGKAAVINDKGCISGKGCINGKGCAARRVPAFTESASSDIQHSAETAGQCERVQPPDDVLDLRPREELRQTSASTRLNWNSAWNS